MSDTGEDILEAFEDIGTSFTILRPGTDFDPEYLNSQLNRQVTKPFTREFFREGTLPYNTEAVAGDIIAFEPTGEKFLITNRTPKVFENQIISYECVLYKCNVSGELRRYSGETFDGDYRLVRVFETIQSNCYALMTEGLFGHGIESDEELARFGLANQECYMPLSYDPRLEDRYEPVSGEYYVVESVKKRRFENVALLELKEDTR
jgi:hypothetical protein